MLRTRLASAGVLLATTVALPAQWAEVGDAGNTPLTAQMPLVPTASFPSITGTLSSASDVDMYVIYITDPATFSATTVGGATYDTQLWLFRSDGVGVTHDDDSVGVQSTITGQFVPVAGLYYLAISSYDNDAIAAGGEIWGDGPFGLERRPDGLRQGEAIEGWDGFGGGSGAYTIALTGCERPRKQIVAPDNHYLTESASALNGGGSTTWWRGGGGRFQVLYDASHFTNLGMGSGAWIDKIFFRGEDGEGNAGGQSWAGVQVRVARTTMTPATLGTDFAANLAAAASVSSVGTIPTVTVRPSLGSMPNNYNIELNLYVAFGGYFYTPATGNLLIDVTMPTAATLPPNGAMMAMQDTTGGLALVRGQGVSTATPAALTGTLSTAPPVIAIGIDGPGGAAPPIVATNESFGSACGGSPASFYQTFRNGQAFDLSAGLTLTPDNPATPTVYTVSSGAGAFDPTKVNLAPNSISDDATVLHNLGFSHNFPGGSTTQISPCTNGYVWLDGTSVTADFTPTVAEFLGSSGTGLARHAIYWTDLHCGLNTTSNPNSGLHVLTDTSGGPGNSVAYVTWLNVAAFNSIGNGNTFHNMQMVIYQATGVVEYRYARMPTHAQASGDFCMVGFTRGRIGGTTPSMNPQTRDLSIETPFTTSPEGTVGNIQQNVASTPVAGGAAYGGRAFTGQSLLFNVTGIAPGTICGVQLLDLVASRPGINIPFIHAPGCGQSTSLNPVLYEVTFLPPANVNGTLPIVVPPGLDGAELIAQYAVLDGLFIPGPLVTAFSNALRVRVGER